MKTFEYSRAGERERKKSIAFLCRLSYDEAERAVMSGRISYLDFERFYRMYLWGAPRYGGSAASIQRGVENSRGCAFVQKRIERMKAVLAKYT